MSKLFISNSVRIFYLYVPGLGPLTSLFCPEGGFLYTMIVPGGGLLRPSSSVPGDGSSRFLNAQVPNLHLLNGLFSHGEREKYPPAALNWVLGVPNLIHTYIHSSTY